MMGITIKHSLKTTGTEGNIPVPVVKRFARYLVHVQSQREAGAMWITSGDIADDLGLTSSTVRRT